MSRANLIRSRELIHQAFSHKIVSDEIHPRRPVLTLRFTNGHILYIRYNSIGEYSYHMQMSSHKLDRIRFDNMDPEWDVETKPHHFHPRNREDIAIQSEMAGNPDHDMELLVEFLKSNQLV